VADSRLQPAEHLAQAPGPAASPAWRRRARPIIIITTTSAGAAALPVRPTKPPTPAARSRGYPQPRSRPASPPPLRKFFGPRPRTQGEQSWTPPKSPRPVEGWDLHK